MRRLHALKRELDNKQATLLEDRPAYSDCPDCTKGYNQTWRRCTFHAGVRNLGRASEEIGRAIRNFAGGGIT